jgi:hypothetical protein
VAAEGLGHYTPIPTERLSISPVVLPLDRAIEPLELLEPFDEVVELGGRYADVDRGARERYGLLSGSTWKAVTPTRRRLDRSSPRVSVRCASGEYPKESFPGPMNGLYLRTAVELATSVRNPWDLLASGRRPGVPSPDRVPPARAMIGPRRRGWARADRDSNPS